MNWRLFTVSSYLSITRHVKGEVCTTHLKVIFTLFSHTLKIIFSNIWTSFGFSHFLISSLSLPQSMSYFPRVATLKAWGMMSGEGLYLIEVFARLAWETCSFRDIWFENLFSQFTQAIGSKMICMSVDFPALTLKF